MAETTVVNCFKTAGFNCQGSLPNVANEARAYKDSNEETVIYNNYAMNSDEQMHGWEDVTSNRNFTVCLAM